MYQNRIRRITPNIRPNSHPQFFIRRSEIAFDERLPFIEHVLETLLESRFGPGSVYQSVSRSSGRPEIGSEPLYDLCDEEPNELLPYYILSTLGRADYQVVEAAYRKSKQMGLVAVRVLIPNSTSALTPNQGRGSP